MLLLRCLLRINVLHDHLDREGVGVGYQLNDSSTRA